jgi:hypothetical protein
MHLTLIQIWPSMVAAVAAWLMFRMSERRRFVSLRRPARCPSCGRRPGRRGCRCTER